MAADPHLPDLDLNHEISIRESQLQTLLSSSPSTQRARDKIECELEVLHYQRANPDLPEELEKQPSLTLLSSSPPPKVSMHSGFAPHANFREFAGSDGNHLSADCRPSSSHGFSAYANDQNATFGRSGGSDDRLSARNTMPLNTSYGYNQYNGFLDTTSRYDTQAGDYNSAVSTPAASSSDSAGTPSSRRSSAAAAGLPTHPVAPAYRSLKRGRESFGQNSGATKNMRIVPTSSPGPPPSRGSYLSISEISEEIRNALGEDAEEQIRQVRRLERDMQERRERERLDEEFAREMQAQFDGTSTYQSTRPSLGHNSAPSNTRQAQLDSKGGFTLPKESPEMSSFAHSSLPSNSFPYAGSSSQSIYGLSTGMGLSGSDHSIGHVDLTSANPSDYLTFDNGTSVAGPVETQNNRQGYYTDGNDEDLAIVDGSDFIPNNRNGRFDRNNSQVTLSGPPGTNFDPVNDSLHNSHGMAFGEYNGSYGEGHSISEHDFGGPNSNFHGQASSNVYDEQSHVDLTSFLGPMGRSISEAATAAFHAVESQFKSLPNSNRSVFSNDYASSQLPYNIAASKQALGSSSNPFDVDNNFSPDENAQYSAYDYRPAGASDTAGELRDLMNNIRPDEDLGASDRTGSPEDMADGCALYEHQKLGVAWMANMEEGTNKGGILADDMGLGKTIQAIALMVSQRSKDPKCKTTLIIAPVALLKQWESEIKIKVKPDRRLSTFLYHGSAKKNVKWEQIRKHDVVLTTYGTLASEMTRKYRIDCEKEMNPNLASSDGNILPLLGDECIFYRVILDEAQNIKNRTTKSAIATYAVKAHNRFCMTGTPMMNNITELYSLVRFLKIRPYCEWEKFSRDFVKPLRSDSITNTNNTMRRLQAFLKAILLRRTKKSEINGKPILTLPPRVTTVNHAVFDKHQLEFYKSLEEKAQARFNRYRQNGTVGQNYSHSLVLLLRLRQACCHPHLIRDYGNGNQQAELTSKDLESFARDLNADVVRRIMEEGIIDCPICMDVVENSTIFLPCGHRTCSECFARISDPSQITDDTGTGDGKVFKCMTCRGNVDPKKITDWQSFQKVHMPTLISKTEVDFENMPNGGDSHDTSSDSGSDSGSDSDSESVSDIDSSLEDSESESDFDLDGFIVPDNNIDGEIKDEPSDDEESSTPNIDKKISKEEAMSEVKKGKLPAKRKRVKKSMKQSKKKNKKSKGKKREKYERDVTKTMSELQKDGRRNLESRRKYMKQLRKDWISSCKVDKCMEILEEIRNREGNEKTIIFSQFTTMLDLLEIPLTERKWSYQRYDGGMGPTARNNAVVTFSQKSSCKIMLISLKAGNAGLNLTTANNVIIFDPFWNPYVEEQAVDRAHRIGQRKTVQVHRLLVQETVEDRIIKLQDDKRAMIEGALDETASRNIARLGVQELAYLFGVQGHH